MAQQTRVSNWVSDTRQQAHAYSNPFALSPALRDRTFYDEPEDGAPPHHDQWSMGSSQPSRSRSRSYVDHAHNDRTQPSRHRTQSQSRSASTLREPIYPSHGPQHYTYPQPHVVARTPGPRTHTSPPNNYQYPVGPAHSPTRQAYVTQPPPGQIYHPPAPVHKDTLYGHASHSRHPSSKPPPQPYLLVQSGGPKAEYKRGVRLHSSRVRARADCALFVRPVPLANLACNTCTRADETARPAALAETNIWFRVQLAGQRSERKWSRVQGLFILEPAPTNAWPGLRPSKPASPTGDDRERRSIISGGRPSRLLPADLPPPTLPSFSRHPTHSPFASFLAFLPRDVNKPLCEFRFYLDTKLTQPQCIVHARLRPRTYNRHHLIFQRAQARSALPSPITSSWPLTQAHENERFM
jgi:hypothetical protein